MKPLRCWLGRHLWRTVNGLTCGQRRVLRACPLCGRLEYADQ